MAFWNAAHSSNDCEAVRAYLQRFPRGLFVELAKLSERRLCDSGRKVTVIEPAAAAAAASSVAAATLTPAAPTIQPAPAVHHRAPAGRGRRGLCRAAFRAGPGHRAIVD